MIYVLIAALVIAILWGVSVYNGLISLRHQLERSWANIDVILKQRYDEIPQLIQVIEQYVGYESGILKDLAEARSHYGAARTISDKIDASAELSLAFKGVAAISEAYPDLKSNENFNQLQGRISNLESTIADRRENYNESVANFNARIEHFPDVLIARLLNYNRQKMYQVRDEEKSTPALKMNLPQFGKKA